MHLHYLCYDKHVNAKHLLTIAFLMVVLLPFLVEQAARRSLLYHMKVRA